MPTAFRASKPLENAGRKRIPKRKGGFKNEVEGGAKEYQAWYVPGNLRKSWRRIPVRKLGKKTRSAFVGPFAERTKQGSTYGRTINTSHGIFANAALSSIRGKGKKIKSLGGRRDFQRRITVPAYKEASGPILKILEYEHANAWVKRLKKNGFQI